MGLFDSDDSKGKLAGLAQLPPSWTPPYFSISSELHSLYRSAIRPGTSISDLLTGPDRTELSYRLSQFGTHTHELSLIVRSNASTENLEQRGRLRSFRSDGTIDGILSAAERIFAMAEPFRGLIGLIVQVHHSPVIWGHLSNERRVSEALRRWICEMHAGRESGANEMPNLQMIRVERVQAAESRPIECYTHRELLHQLRRVARSFYDKRQRRHLEWVWNGRRLWVVQNDTRTF